MVIPMAKDYDLVIPESKVGARAVASNVINRRQFLRYGFNTAAGVLTASLGVLGFASILLPPGGGTAGDLSVKFWAKGREDTAWYGAKHLQTMTKADFVAEAAVLLRILLLLFLLVVGNGTLFLVSGLCC